MGNDKTRNKSKDAQTMGITHCAHPFLQGRGLRRGRLFILFLLLFLTLNFGVKGYWKIKSYSFQSYFKDVWEICHNKGFNEDYCVLVDFSRPSGEDRMAIIDLKTLSVLDTGPCAHGKGEGNSAWKPRFSNKEGSKCSSLGNFKIAEKSYSANVGLCFALDGLDSSNDNARRRHILIHSSRYVDIMHHLTSYLPLSNASWGCFTTSPAMLKKIEAICDKSKKPILLYAYK